jgi:hypothetical protein
MCESSAVSDSLLSHIIEQWLHESGYIKRYALVRGAKAMPYIQQRRNQTVIAWIHDDYLEIARQHSYSPRIVIETRRINASDPEFFNVFQRILKACKYV